MSTSNDSGANDSGANDSGSNDSNPDDKKMQQLDDLYQRLGDDDPESTSPPDIDTALRAAAREQQGAASTSNWQRRYGWATAATVLMTSALFLSLPDTNDPSPLSHEPAQQEFQAKTQDRQRVRQEAAAPATGMLETHEPESAAADLAIEGFSKQLRPGKAISSRKAMSSSKSRIMSKEKSTENCVTYQQMMISRLCQVSFPDSEQSVDKNSENAVNFELYASEQSPCAGQKFALNSTTLKSIRGMPTLSAGGDESRVFIDYELEDRAVSKTQTDELVCESGRLTLQSLARGR